MSFYGTDINSAFNTLDSFQEVRPSHLPVIPIQMSTPITKLAPPPQQPPSSQVQQPQVQQQQHQQPKISQSMVKRRETIKFLTYALIILFALSLYSVFEMIIKEIVVGNDFGYKQEIGMRIVYPIFVFFVLWNIRTFIQ